jgi:DNA-directed RNA polymerase subunit M/transcription elongation factor TFIIS
MIIVTAIVLILGVLAFTLAVRAKDLPEPEPVSPFKHLDERKDAIYENLRDLQFEYRLGKLSEQDYEQTKKDLQKELAGVMAEIDALRQKLGAGTVAAVPQKAPAKQAAPQKTATGASAGAKKTPRAEEPATVFPGTVCPHCGAKFASPMKFCGECGKAMLVETR